MEEGAGHSTPDFQKFPSDLYLQRFFPPVSTDLHFYLLSVALIKKHPGAPMFSSQDPPSFDHISPASYQLPACIYTALVKMPSPPLSK